MIACINCSKEIDSDFCPHCGQKNPIKKITIANMWSDFLSRVYGFDGMFPRTLKDLTIRPGEAARSYISGNRVRYYGPLGYLFITLTIYVLLASLLGVDLTEFTMASSRVEETSGSGQMALSREINLWIIENMRLASFIVATWSVLFIWLFFKKSGFNLIETSVIVFYINGHTVWITIITLFIYFFTGHSINMTWVLSLTLLFMIYSLVNFYTHQHKAKTFMYALLSIVLSYVSLTILFVLGLGIFLHYHPSELEKIRPKNNRSKIEMTP
jgi:magnesium-transporting ATPase (P-type)